MWVVVCLVGGGGGGGGRWGSESQASPLKSVASPYGSRVSVGEGGRDVKRPRGLIEELGKRGGGGRAHQASFVNSTLYTVLSVRSLLAVYLVSFGCVLGLFWGRNVFR